MVRTTLIAAAAAMSVALGAGLGAQTPAPPQAFSGGVAAGQRLYTRETCSYCHGTAAQGSITGPHLAAIARNLEGFTRYVRRPTGSMPAFTERVVSDQDLAAIFAFLKSLPAATPVTEIPLLERLKQK